MTLNQVELQVNTARSKWAPWILTARPKTLVASFVPVLVGTLLAKGTTGTFNGWIALCMFVCSVFIQTGTNLINDAIDFKKGADGHLRLGPVRVTQLGLLSPQQVFWAGMMSFFLAFLVGIPLIIQGGSLILIALVISAICGYLYTGGPAPLAYSGLGDFFVVIFFGWVCTCASYYLQTGTIDGWAFLAGTQVGLHSTVMIAVNNLRDIAGDAQVGKRTLAVRFGVFFGRCEITCLVFLPFLLSMLWFIPGMMNPAIIPFMCFPQALRLVNNVWHTEPSAAYNGFLAQGAFLHLLFGALLGLGFTL